MTDRPTALITDATHFVGPALVRRLLAGGARVLAADDAFADPAAAARFAADVPGAEPIAQGTPDATLAAVRLVAPAIDVLCVGGAHPAPRTPAATLTPAVTRSFFEDMAIEPLAYVAGVVEGMMARRRGRIVFLGSAGPLGGIPGYVAYAAARSAINGAVRSLAQELAPHRISVNAVAANFIATEDYYPRALLDDPAKLAKITARIPMGRVGEPDEVAEAAAFFALAPAGFVTGQVLAIAGGWT